MFQMSNFGRFSKRGPDYSSEGQAKKPRITETGDQSLLSFNPGSQSNPPAIRRSRFDPRSQFSGVAQATSSSSLMAPKWPCQTQDPGLSTQAWPSPPWNSQTSAPPQTVTRQFEGRSQSSSNFSKAFDCYPEMEWGNGSQLSEVEFNKQYGQEITDSKKQIPVAKYTKTKPKPAPPGTRILHGHVSKVLAWMKASLPFHPLLVVFGRVIFAKEVAGESDCKESKTVIILQDLKDQKKTLRCVFYPIDRILDLPSLADVLRVVGCPQSDGGLHAFHFQVTECQPIPIQWMQGLAEKGIKLALSRKKLVEEE